MKREIKFRAWDKKTKRFTSDGIYIHLGGSAVVFDDEDGGKSGLWEHGITQDFDLEIMQFTGLNDKNGREIWEGDVVRRFGYVRPLKIGFQHGTFCHELPDGGFVLWIADAEKYDEVIGNIYENPELITKE